MLVKHVSAYCEAIIRFTNVGYWKLITMRAYVRSHHLRLRRHYRKDFVYIEVSVSVVTEAT